MGRGDGLLLSFQSRCKATSKHGAMDIAARIDKESDDWTSHFNEIWILKS
jgi:hypothetical protein